MRVDRELKAEIINYWNDKRVVAQACAEALGEQLWEDDDMMGTTRDRTDHQYKIAILGLYLGESRTPNQFIKSIRKIEVP